MAPEGIETAQRSANEESEQIAGTAPELVPARMLNEYAYCPRLAYLEWVQGEFADSVDTIEGSLPAGWTALRASWNARSFLATTGNLEWSHSASIT